jgi:hypothetical protein
MAMQRANFTWAWMAIAVLFLAGCGGNDQQQRTAFISFLQTRIVDKPGIHVPTLTDEERASFGPYAEQYAIITDFNKAMDESVSPKLAAAMSAGSIRSLADAVANREKLQAAKSSINAMNGALGDSVARADAAHAKLEQPADLKGVYDKAYDRLVTQPAAAFKDIAPVMDTVLGQAIDLGKFLDEHRSSVRLSGPMIETSDPAVLAAVNNRLRALQANQQAVQAAQARMQSVVYGSPR